MNLDVNDINEHDLDTLMKVGRKPKYKDPDVMKAKIKEYFIHTKGEQVTETLPDGTVETKWKRYPECPCTMGLALFLGFASKTSLYEYEKKKKFSDIIKFAKGIIEKNYVMIANGKYPSYALLALRNFEVGRANEANNNTNQEYNIKI